MLLPEKFFDSTKGVADDGLRVPEISELSEAINSGEIDLSQFEDKEVPLIPQNTILGAPPVITKPTEQEAPQSSDPTPPGPTKEDALRLEKVESLLMALEGQIKKLNDSVEADQTTTQQAQNDAMDELLKSPVDDKDNTTVKIIPPNLLPKSPSTPLEQQIPISGSEFNKERLIELIQQKEILLQERNNILKPSNYFNTIEPPQQVNASSENILNTSNQSINNETTESNTIKNNIFENINNVSDILPQKDEEGIIAQPASIESPELTTPALPQLDTADKITNINDNSATNSVTNENSDNIFQNSTDSKTTAFNTENVNQQEFLNPTNIFENISTVNQEKETYESFIPPGGNTGNTLPSPENEMNLNAKSVVGILQGIEKGIITLNEGLGSNFKNLNQSMQGLNASVVNNSYNNFNQSGSDSTGQIGGKKAQQKATMPDYRGDYPQSSDFPPGFDITKLGGTNLPNPQSIL
jgi:hypothetical protein